MTQSSEGLDRSMAFSQSAQIGIATAFVVMIVTNLVGNSLVVLTVVKTRSMRTPMNYLLVNLAIADMTVGAFIAPRYVFNHAYTHPVGTTGKYLCKLVTGEVFTWVGAICSIYTLVAISIERYYAVMKPHSYKGRFTMKKFKLTAAACWIFATLCNLHMFIFSYFDEKTKFCNFDWPFKDFNKYHSVFVVFVFGAIPICTMACLYSRVTYQLWFKKTAQASQQGTMAARKRVTKMVLTVSIIFCITWMPNIVTYPVSAYSEKPLYDIVHIITIVLATFNSSINPIVYSLQSRVFRKNMLRVITCRARQIRCTNAGKGATASNENQPNVAPITTPL